MYKRGFDYIMNQFSRTELLFGKEAMNKIAAAHIAVFGIGGVGGYTAEALARSGVGTLTLVDDDRICLTNINRQIFATTKTVGSFKTDAAEERLKDINPRIIIIKRKCFYTSENASEFDFSEYDYIVDAVDTVSAKLALAENAQNAGVPIISCMGAGNKLEPTRFEVADIYETSVCPLAKVMRYECRKRGIEKLKCVYSKEPAMKPAESDKNSCKHHCICPPDTKRTCVIRRQVPGSNAFVPSVAGLIIAGEVLKDLTFGI